VRTEQLTTGQAEFTVLQLDRPSRSIFHAGSPVAAVTERIDELQSVRRWLEAHPTHTVELDSHFRGFVVTGRRSTLPPGEATNIRTYNEELIGTSVRTYDWLIEAAIAVLS